MPCYSPLEGWRSRVRTATGKLGVTFNRRDAYTDLPISVPCGQCIGCRLERSRQWALRCMYECQLHQDNCFVTLTYDDAHLPPSGSLVKRDFQLFIKRLRKDLGVPLRYFHCGEYGDLLGRPHYHAILFGVTFDDSILYKESSTGDSVYTSDRLSRIWGRGFATFGAATFESCAYVARYVMKKRTGLMAEKHYQRVIPETGEIVSLLPEYTTMSLKPAIAKGWFDKFSADVFPSDFVVSRGIKMRPPKYFERLLAVRDESLLDQLKLKRVRQALRFKADSTPERLRVRERVKIAQISSLKRSLEV